MAKRKKLPNNIAMEVITACKRRCCLCWGLRNDNSEKQGQIAHLDGNPSNNHPDNLAWLCLEHHDRYDSKTSQSKGFTPQEVKHYRDELRKVLSVPTEGSPPDSVTRERKAVAMTEIELTGDHITVLRVLAHSGQLYDTEIALKLRWNNTKTKHCLDVLCDADFLETYVGEYGSLYHLSKKGRAFAVGQGLVK